MIYWNGFGSRCSSDESANVFSDFCYSSEFEDTEEGADGNYAESLMLESEEFEETDEDVDGSYAKSLLTKSGEFGEEDEDFDSSDVESTMPETHEFENTRDTYDDDSLPEDIGDRTNNDFLDYQGDWNDFSDNIGFDVRKAVPDEKSVEERNQEDTVSKETGKAGGKAGKLSMQQLEDIFLKETPVRNVLGNLYYFDGRSYRKATTESLKIILRSKFPRAIVEKISGMFQYREVVQYIKINPELTLDPRTFPHRKERNYISFENTVVDARTMQIYEHRLEFPLFFSVKAKFQKNPEATPEFDRFLADISGGDKEIEQLIWEMLGYLCLHANDAKVFFVLGLAPDSGKSIFIELVNLLFEEECLMHVPLQDMGDKFAMTDLPYTAVNTHADLSSERVSENSVGVVKNLTGDSAFCFNKKFEDPATTVHHMRMLFGTNTQISLKAQDEAFWNRMKIVPFNYSIPKAEQNKNLLGELWEEKDAIVSKAVRAVSRVIARNYQFTKPAESRRMWLEWSGNVNAAFQSIMGELVEITHDEQDKLQAESLYNDYISVCKAQGIKECIYRKFMDNMQSLYGVKKGKARFPERENPVSCLLGIRRRIPLEDGEE